MTHSQSGRTTKTKSTFRLEYAVGTNINASPEKIWALLTNAKQFPSWNSAVASIDGDIALGQQIQVKVPIAPTRVFKLRVSEFEPGRRMVWRDGSAPMFQGVRTYTLTPQADGSTRFDMSEVFSGLMLPMIAGSLPDFGPSFEAYAADLKRAAESN
jgi:hypothetical protein